MTCCPPGTGADLLPARHGRRRQGRRGHLLLHLRMVLPRQGTDHQIQPETRVDHGARAVVLEPRIRGVLSHVWRADLSMKLMMKSVMPLSMGVWWYATAYAIFLAPLPFLAEGLKALGQECHFSLAATVLVIWGLTSFIPGMIKINDGFFGFIYLFILISAYKWYMEPFTTRQVWLTTGIGLGFFLLYTCASITLSLLGHDMGIYITGAWKLPVIMVGFGVFLLFDRVTFHNRTINRIAQSAFVVYLITDYAASESLLWARLFNLQNLYQQLLAILRILGILLAIYAVCILIDFARQALFAFTIDRRRGHWFDLLQKRSISFKA